MRLIASGLPTAGRFETYILPRRGFAAGPTHDGLTMVVCGWPYAEFEANRSDVERHYMDAIAMVPSFAERVRGARREARFVGAALPNYLRRPFGPGWALVGDAGYNRDAITAQGISDAFLDAEGVAAALHQALSGAASLEVAMARHQAARDRRVLPMYEFTCQLATLEPPPPELQQLLAATATSQEAMDGFVRVNAGVTSPADFFSEENVGRIFAAAAARSQTA